MGLLTSPRNGNGFVDQQVLEPLLAGLRARYPRFGGVMGWEYFNAEPGGEAAPWQWAERMAGALAVGYGGVSSAAEPALSASRLEERPGTDPGVPHDALFSAENVEQLVALGFGRMQAVAALNATGGNVETAAGLLFED